MAMMMMMMIMVAMVMVMITVVCACCLAATPRQVPAPGTTTRTGIVLLEAQFEGVPIVQCHRSLTVHHLLHSIHDHVQQRLHRLGHILTGGCTRLKVREPAVQ